MLHRSIKFVHVAVLAFSAVVAFLFLRSLDEDWVLGHTAVVWVTDTDGSTTGAEVVRTVQEFAAEHRAGVAREVPDLGEPYSRRHLYLTTGGPRAQWVSQGYPAFDTSYRTDLHPIDDLGPRDPRGFWYVFGDARDPAALAEVFEGLGLRASVNHPFSLSELAPVYGGSALYRSLFVVALAVVATTGAGVLLNAKGYGVLRLHGMSYGRILLRDLRQLAVFWTVAGAAVSLVAAVGLAVYNGLAWVTWYALLALALTAGLGLVALGTHAATLWLTFQTGILGALKGDLPARAASVSAYAARVPALLLALSIAGAALLAGQDVMARKDSSERYQEIGDAASIGLNGSLAGAEALQALDRRVGTWLRQADGKGQIVVAGHRTLQQAAPRENLPSGDILLVNESFLARQPLRAVTGDRIASTAEHRDRVRLLVPDRLAPYAQKIRGLVPGLLNPGRPDSVDSAEIATVLTRDGQQVFTYNPRGQSRLGAAPGSDESFLQDPVLVVFPNGSPYLSDKSYTAYASQGSIVFPDPEDVADGVRRHDLDTYVTRVSPVAEQAARELRELVGEFRLQLFNLAVAVTVLLITGVGVSIVHSRKNAQLVFARHISGWRFAATHRVILGVEGLVALLLAGWIPWQVWRQNQKLQTFEKLGVPPPRAPYEITGVDMGLTAGLLAVEVVAVLTALAVFHRRIVKEGATQS